MKSPDFLETIIKKERSLKFLEHQPEPWLYLMGQNETKFLIDKIINQADGQPRGRGQLVYQKVALKK